jgi:hypothetical protein
MGQRIRHSDRHERRVPVAAALVHRGEATGIPFKCDTEHHWRLNARAGDRCFCGERQKGGPEQ